MSIPYGPAVLEHFRRPRNQRRLEQPSVSREGFNPLCGDRVRIELAIADGVITEAAFTANACAICTAAASVLTERVSGSDVADALVHPAEIAAALGTELPAGRLACAELPVKTFHAALAEFSSHA